MTPLVACPLIINNFVHVETKSQHILLISEESEDAQFLKAIVYWDTCNNITDAYETWDPYCFYDKRKCGMWP